MNRSRFVSVSIALLTVVCHFVFGIWYWRQWVNKEMRPPHPPLELRGEDYLRVFPGWGSPAERDSSAYNTAALSILNSGVPRTRSGALHMHAPIYCYFIALCYKIGGLRILSVAFPQAVLAGAACFLVSLIAGRVLPSHAVAASSIAGFLYLINLRAAMYVGYVSPTIVLVVLVALTVAFAHRPLKGTTTIAVAGLMALGIFTQAAFFSVAGGVAAWLALQAFRDRQRAPLLGALTIVAVTVAKIVLSSTGGTKDDLQQLSREVCWDSNNPRFEGLGWTSLLEDRLGPNPWTSWHVSEQEQQRFDSYLSRAGGDGQRAFLLWSRENPGQYLKLCFIRFRTTLSPFTGQMSPRNRAISTVVWVLIFPAAFYGLWKMRALPVAQLVVLAYSGYIMLATVLTEDWYLRFRVPLEAALAVFAAVGYCRWMEHLTRRYRGANSSSAR